MDLLRCKSTFSSFVKCKIEMSEQGQGHHLFDI
ncbi:unnamed protein product [Spirodela intermedia]|uniref:Uncharacterized protein n=1 Tax=Spirodela intermedia TaxID=51605 RepID=A0A7I8KAN4_SPIIN|nr:unnamed protein product [Spirodela intermedia]